MTPGGWKRLFNTYLKPGLGSLMQLQLLGGDTAAQYSK